jgi:hypothetical protein
MVLTIVHGKFSKPLSKHTLDELIDLEYTLGAEIQKRMDKINVFPKHVNPENGKVTA